jgi:hypothetical protein
LFLAEQFLPFFSSAAAAVQLFSSLNLFVLSHKVLSPEKCVHNQNKKAGRNTGCSSNCPDFADDGTLVDDLQ